MKTKKIRLISKLHVHLPGGREPSQMWHSGLQLLTYSTIICFGTYISVWECYYA